MGARLVVCEHGYVSDTLDVDAFNTSSRPVRACRTLKINVPGKVTREVVPSPPAAAEKVKAGCKVTLHYGGVGDDDDEAE
jgi:hypothetical protein